MKRYIRSNSNGLPEELDNWVGKLYGFMYDLAFMDFPDDFPIIQTKKDIANGDVQKYIDYFILTIKYLSFRSLYSTHLFMLSIVVERFLLIELRC